MLMLSAGSAALLVHATYTVTGVHDCLQASKAKRKELNFETAGLNDGGE